MDKITAERARDLLKELTQLEIIQEEIENNKNRWWGFTNGNITPQHYVMPDVLREEFKAAVERSIARTNKELKKL